MKINPKSKAFRIGLILLTVFNIFMCWWCLRTLMQDRGRSAASPAMRDGGATVQIVGCGVDLVVSLKPGESISLSELLARVAPLPLSAEAITVKVPGNPGTLTQLSLEQATNANLAGSARIFGGSSICFVHDLMNY